MALWSQPEASSPIHTHRTATARPPHGHRTAGLRYAERMGERPEHRLSLRHFNKVVRACCRDPDLRSLRSVLRVRACMLCLRHT